MRGQSSIEYMAIVAAVFVVLATVTVPQMVKPGRDAAQDTEFLSQARAASDWIANAINGTYGSPEGPVITEFFQFQRSWSLKMSEDNLRVGVGINEGTKWAESSLKYGFDNSITDISGGIYTIIVEQNPDEKEHVKLNVENNKIYINIRPGDGG